MCSGNHQNADGSVNVPRACGRTCGGHVSLGATLLEGNGLVHDVGGRVGQIAAAPALLPPRPRSGARRPPTAPSASTKYGLAAAQNGEARGDERGSLVVRHSRGLSRFAKLRRRPRLLRGERDRRGEGAVQACQAQRHAASITNADGHGPVLVLRFGSAASRPCRRVAREYWLGWDH